MRDHVSAQVIAHLIGIPAHAGEEVLHPVRRRVARVFSQLPAVLALHRSKQALQIGPRPPARLDPAKARRDPLDQPIQPAAQSTASSAAPWPSSMAAKLSLNSRL